MHDEYNPGRRLVPRLWARGLIGIAAMIMAALACYGTLALTDPLVCRPPVPTRSFS